MERTRIAQSELLQGLSVIFLRMVGLWKPINDFRSTGERSLFLHLIVWLTIISCVPYFCFQITSLFYLKLSVQMVTFVYLNVVPGMQIVAKLFLVWYKMGEIATLYDLVRKDLLHSIPEERKVRATEIYSRISKNCNLACNLAFSFNMGVVFTWILMPGVDCGNGRYKILGGWYPFPYGETPYFEAVFIYELIMMFYVGTLRFLYECVRVVPTIALYAHFVVLGDYVAGLKRVTPENLHLSNTELNRRQAAFVSDYSRLLRYGEVLKDVCNFLNTFILTTGTIVLIIGSLFFIFGERDLSFTVKLAFFLMYQVIEIALICYSSSYIEDASSKIPFSVYSSGWFEADRRFKTTAQMVMVRAQRPVTLVFWGLYPVNLETFIGILRFVYSTCAVFAKAE